MDEKIKIFGKLTFDEPASHNSAYRVVNQIENDSTYGTFLDFPDYWNDKWEVNPNSIASNEGVNQIDDEIYSFELNINSRFFSVERGGLQHLVGILTGDLFHLRIPDVPDFNLRVDRFELPPSLREQAKDRFRNGCSHDIESIRSLFQLSKKRPLLAFSFKPRVGVSTDALREVTMGVLQAGFNVVELDTRNLHLSEKRIDELLSIAEDVSEMEFNHVARFSPNLSLPSNEALRLCGQFIDVQSSPYVVKVDGGMEGMGTLQELRKHLYDGSDDSTEDENRSTQSHPITTTYPLLRKHLQGKIPSEQFVDLLSLSGADIIYPGGRPDLGGGARSLGAKKKTQLVDSVERYQRFTDQGWPMPTIAGGIHAGELHAFYELVGPDVAYFLGGAVALHRDGPVAGAELCSKVIDEAIRLRKEKSVGDEIPDLKNNLVKRVESSYGSGDDERFGYRSPQDLIDKVYSLDSYFDRL